MSRNKKVKNFKQEDSRWARVPYPKRPFFVADSGCGPTAIADLIVTNPKYAKKTPEDTANWLAKRGYATYGDGTAWAGITACPKAYGFKVAQHDNMSSFWAEMKKSGRMAIISFRGGSKGGVTWTLGGHFLACSGMTIKNGQHKLYMLDPGPRGHDGWYTYEKHMKGLIAQLWTCYLPDQKTEKKVKTVKKKTMKELVAYARKRANQHQKYSQKKGMSWKTHYNCHWMTANIYKACGYPTIYKRISGGGKPYFYKKPNAKNHLGPYLVQKRKAGLVQSKLRAGDIVVRRLKTANGYHSAVYLGDGKVSETTSGRGAHIGKLTKKYVMAFRVPEPYTATYEVTHTRALRESWTAKSTAKKKLPKGTKFKTSCRRGNWVKVKSVYNPKTKKWDKCTGWVCLKSKGGSRCKKIK